MPKLKHPSSRKQIDVAPEQVSMYESQGWRAVAANAPAKRAPRKTATPTKGAAK